MNDIRSDHHRGERTALTITPEYRFTNPQLHIAIQLLPSFIHLPPDEAAKAAINYAKALIKELER